MIPETELRGTLNTTVMKELLVAVSGVGLVLFILAHLAGNFIIYWGPGAFNSYAQHLHTVPTLLWGARVVLISAFVVHISLSIWLALANRAARTERYVVRRYLGGTNFAKLTMIYTGLLILIFVVLHLHDFDWRDQTGPVTIVKGMNNGESLGLFGLVWNSFANPVHSALYVLAMCILGLHFSNAVSTIWVTTGVLSDAATAKVRLGAQILGAVIALAFSSIPIYVLIASRMSGS